MRRRKDGGFALVLLALTLMTLLAFAAFAVDLGALYNYRRQDQSAADSASLAAAYLLGETTDTALVAAAKEYAHDTLGVTLTATDWNSCAADADALAVVAAGSNCISYSGNRRQVRVRIPDQQYETTFGAIVGSDTFRHAAFAVAGLVADGYGGVLPYAVTGGSADGGFGCLQSNSSGQASSYCGSTTGNFGFIDLSHYGDADLGTTRSCGSGDISTRLRNNSAMGTDHDLSLITETDVHTTTVVDTTACLTLTPSPNAATTQTGNQSNDITAGLFYQAAAFPDGHPSRLRRADDDLFDGGGSSIPVLGVNNPGLDNNALWRFIPPGYGPGEATSADIPSSCKRDQFVDASGNYYATGLNNPDVPNDVEAFVNSSTGLVQPRDRILGLLARCFAHYRGLAWNGSPIGSLQTPEACDGGSHPECQPCSGGVCDDPVFALNSTADDEPDLYDIQYTPRFGYVPQISDFPSGTSAAREFLRFRAIFLYRLKIEVGGTTHSFDPGFTSGSTSAPPATGSFDRVGETSVFVFPDRMLPGGLSGEDAPFEIGTNRFVRLVR